MDRVVHLGIYKGGAHSEISAGIQGEYGQQNVHLGEIILVCPLPLMSKGESDWLLLPSSPKGEIVGIMIHMLYLMATHSSQMINYSATKFTHFHEDKSFFHVEKSSRTFMKIKVSFM